MIEFSYSLNAVHLFTVQHFFILINFTRVNYNKIINIKNLG